MVLQNMCFIGINSQYVGNRHAISNYLIVKIGPYIKVLSSTYIDFQNSTYSTLRNSQHEL